MKKLALSLTAAFCVLGLILIIRTLTFRSRQISIRPVPALSLNTAVLIERLARVVQFRTVSRSDLRQPPSAELAGMREFLDASFPLTHRFLEKEIVNGQSLLYKWPGRESSLKAVLLMAHMDVVPVDPSSESAWRYPPFSGVLADGFIWGRGTMDDKSSMLGILEAVEHLLRTGFSPRRTIYLAFGHDEEVGGQEGAAKIAELLGARHIEFEFALDEGLNIYNGIIGGIDAPVALIGVAEKGDLSLRLAVQTSGGHSSIPPLKTAIGLLSRTLERIHSAPLPSRLGLATREMLEFLGPEMAWSQRLPLANLWLFGPLVRWQLAASPLTDALIRTTIVPTIFHAGVKENVLPSRATAVVNLRLLPGDTLASATEYIHRLVVDPTIKIEPLPLPIEPSTVSDTTGPSFGLIHRTIRETAPQVLVAPALLIAATDSRHYQSLTKNIFRFLPITVGPNDTRRYHGIDERIAVRDYERLIRFYVRLLENLNRL